MSLWQLLFQLLLACCTLAFLAACIALLWGCAASRREWQEDEEILETIEQSEGEQDAREEDS